MEGYLTARQEIGTAWGKLASAYANKQNCMEEQRESIENSHRDLDEKKAAAATENAGSTVSFNDSDILDINAGGQIVRVARGTLTQLKGTVLEAMFSGRWEKKLQRDSKGRIFLDVNPACFKSIVDYLNECKIAPPDSPPDPPHVDSENQAFLDALLNAFGLTDIRPISLDSNILTGVNYINALYGFLEEDSIVGGLDLLYRGTRDGLDPEQFHQKCDNQGSTVTIFKSSKGYIFGGFTDTSWKSPPHSAYVTSMKSFLFGLRCAGGQNPVKLSLREEGFATLHGSNFGPSFGAGDLWSSSLSIGRGSSQLVCSYACPAGVSQYHFTGAENFTISDLEVFRVNTSLKPEVSKGTRKRKLPSSSEEWEDLAFSEFPDDIETLLEAEKNALAEATIELADLQEAFDKEMLAIKCFAQGADSEIITLNVSGHMMSLHRSTLSQFPESVLYKQFADPLWNTNRATKSDASSVRDWTPKQVTDWAKGIPGLSVDITSYFTDVTGSELLALKRVDIKELDSSLKPGSVALLVESIQKLRDEEAEGDITFIEHSAYCFGKIIDHMRLIAMNSALGVPAPSPPTVKEAEMKRFKRIVEFYFPTESSAQFLG